MRKTLGLWAVILLSVCGPLGAQEPAGDFKKIKHIVIIYQEKWSFDGLYGKFPGADNLDQAGAALRQVDLKGIPLKTLPQPYFNERDKEGDDRFPKNLPVAPY